MSSRFKSRLLFSLVLVLCSLVLIAAVTPTHIWQLMFDSDVNGNGKSITNLGGLTVTGSASIGTLTVTGSAFIARIAGASTNQFLIATNTGADGNVLTKTGTNSQWATPGGAGGTGIQTNGGSGTNNPFYELVEIRNTNLVFGYSNAIAGHAGRWLPGEGKNNAILGGAGNQIGLNGQFPGDGNVIGGGYSNWVKTGRIYEVIAGGAYNVIDSDGAVISGGANNSVGALAQESAIGGGLENYIQASASYSFISGGHANTVIVNSVGAAVLGGELNLASGNYAMAAGHQAYASNRATFVWSDGFRQVPFASVQSNTFLVSAQNGMAINTNDPAGNALRVQGVMDASQYTRSNGLQMVTVISTNFIDGKVYVNTYGRTITIQSVYATLVMSGVNGHAGLDAQIDGAVVATTRFDTISTDGARTIYMAMPSFSVMTNQVYCFTNNSAGGGSNAGNPNGGQIIIH